MVSYCCPGRTFMLACSGRNVHGSFEFTPPSNCTVISRSDLRPSSAAARSPSTADFSNRTPHTFSQAMRYIGTSEKVNATDRKSVVEGKSVAGGGNLGGCRTFKK